jgi:hypothetical protein
VGILRNFTSALLAELMVATGSHPQSDLLAESGVAIGAAPINL